MYSIAAITLGCKVNQYDTEAILRDFAAIGFSICSHKELADVYLINTCTVTNISDKKSRQMINMALQMNPAAVVVAYGCYAQVQPDALRKIEGVSLVIGTEDKERVAEIVAKHLELSYSTSTAVLPPKRTRAYLKIQDGCEQFCSYCIVPYARGAVKSRPIDELISEAEKLVEAGCKEIVLTGIQIASYGKDFTNGNENIVKLINEISKLKQLKRLRLGSLDPSIVTDDFVEALNKSDIICDHFHLSLQSGCDITLERMNRKYTAAEYTAAADKLRQSFPQSTLTTDIIVGFPGESNQDFAESMDFVGKMGFFRVHVFPYSPKKGTPAADMPHQVSQSVKKQRSQQMRKLADKVNLSTYQQYIGKSLPVLFESQINGYWEGHSSNYLTIRAKSNKNLENNILAVSLTHIKDGIAYGEVRKDNV